MSGFPANYASISHFKKGIYVIVAIATNNDNLPTFDIYLFPDNPITDNKQDTCNTVLVEEARQLRPRDRDKPGIKLLSTSRNGGSEKEEEEKLTTLA